MPLKSKGLSAAPHVGVYPFVRVKAFSIKSIAEAACPFGLLPSFGAKWSNNPFCGSLLCDQDVKFGKFAQNHWFKQGTIPWCQIGLDLPWMGWFNLQIRRGWPPNPLGGYTHPPCQPGAACARTLQQDMSHEWIAISLLASRNIRFFFPANQDTERHPKVWLHRCGRCSFWWCPPHASSQTHLLK